MSSTSSASASASSPSSPTTTTTTTTTTVFHSTSVPVPVPSRPCLFSASAPPSPVSLPASTGPYLPPSLASDLAIALALVLALVPAPPTTTTTTTMAPKVAAVARTLERMLPLFLLAYMIFSCYVMNYIAVTYIILYQGDFFSRPLPLPVGIVAIIVWLVLLLGFVSSIATAWWYTWLHAPFWRPFGLLSHPFWLRPLLPVTFVSARFKAWYWGSMARPLARPKPPVLRWQQARVVHGNGRPNNEFWSMRRLSHTNINHFVRDEESCRNARRRRRDRTYHSYWPIWGEGTLVTTCMPLYDHWCHFILAAVYLHSIKPYLLTMIYLMAYSLFVGIFTMWAASRPELVVVKYMALPASVFSFVLVVWLCGVNMATQVYWLGLHNVTAYERAHPGIFTMAFPLADKYVLFKGKRCPWDQGSWRRNWTHVMGSGLLMLVPFWKPQRVHDYDDPAKFDFDEQFGPDFQLWIQSTKTKRAIEENRRQGPLRKPPAAHRRRDQASSTGVDV